LISVYHGFGLDDVLQSGRTSGTGGGWAQKTYTITGSGNHTLKWRYVKDSRTYSQEE
jgi:hypothetical protein